MSIDDRNALAARKTQFDSLVELQTVLSFASLKLRHPFHRDDHHIHFPPYDEAIQCSSNRRSANEARLWPSPPPSLCSFTSDCLSIGELAARNEHLRYISKYGIDGKSHEKDYNTSKDSLVDKHSNKQIDITSKNNCHSSDLLDEQWERLLELKTSSSVCESFAQSQEAQDHHARFNHDNLNNSANLTAQITDIVGVNTTVISSSISDLLDTSHCISILQTPERGQTTINGVTTRDDINDSSSDISDSDSFCTEKVPFQPPQGSQVTASLSLLRRKRLQDQSNRFIASQEQQLSFGNTQLDTSFETDLSRISVTTDTAAGVANDGLYTEFVADTDVSSILAAVDISDTRSTDLSLITAAKSFDQEVCLYHLPDKRISDNDFYVDEYTAKSNVNDDGEEEVLLPTVRAKALTTLPDDLQYGCDHSIVLQQQDSQDLFEDFHIRQNISKGSFAKRSAITTSSSSLPIQKENTINHEEAIDTNHFKSGKIRGQKITVSNTKRGQQQQGHNLHFLPQQSSGCVKQQSLICVVPGRLSLQSQDLRQSSALSLLQQGKTNYCSKDKQFQDGHKILIQSSIRHKSAHSKEQRNNSYNATEAPMNSNNIISATSDLAITPQRLLNLPDNDRRHFRTVVPARVFINDPNDFPEHHDSFTTSNMNNRIVPLWQEATILSSSTLSLQLITSKRRNEHSYP